MRSHKKSISLLVSNRPLLIATGTFFGFIAGVLLMSTITAPIGRWSPYQYSLSTTSAATAVQLKAVLHYATSKVVPQQTLQEITESYNVLQSLGSCNFLIFGLGYDSLMWTALNPNGTTLFLEESPKWVTTVLRDAPFLNARTLSYRTKLQDADHLLQTYKDEPDCHPKRAFLKGNVHCKLALENLPDEVYEREWDVIMIDAPRGYAPEQPGRMAAIFSAAVMARSRKRAGNTHVFLHDVERKVEDTFAKEFLCMKYKVRGVGKLWHFEIPPAIGLNNGSSTKFCQ